MENYFIVFVLLWSVLFLMSTGAQNRFILVWRNVVSTGSFTAPCVMDAFITTWQTTTNNESVMIPATGTGCLYNVIWGDGNFDTNQTGGATHTYATAGIYTVTITGTLPRIFINNNSSQQNKTLTIEQTRTLQCTHMERAYQGCNHFVLNATNTPNLHRVANRSLMFSDTTSLVDNQDQIGYRGVVSFNINNNKNEKSINF